MSSENYEQKLADRLKAANQKNGGETMTQPEQRPRLRRQTAVRLPAVMYELRGDTERATISEHRLRIQRISGPIMTEEARRLRRERVNARIRDMVFDRINGEHHVTKQIEE